MSEHRCGHGVFDNLRRDWFPCGRRASVEEGGGHWCKQHAPSAVAARKAASSACENARYKAMSWRYAAEAACAGVDDPHPGELAALRAEVARMKERG